MAEYLIDRKIALGKPLGNTDYSRGFLPVNRPISLGDSTTYFGMINETTRIPNGLGVMTDSKA